MLRNILLIVALVGTNILLLNWYRNEAHNLDTDSSGTLSNVEISAASSGTILGLTPEESNDVKALCDRNKDYRLSVEEIDTCLNDVAAKAAAEAAAADQGAKQAEQTEAQQAAKNVYDRGVAALIKLKNYNYRGLFEQLTTAMRKNKVATVVVLLVLLLPLHFAGALPSLSGFFDSAESSFSKVFQFHGSDNRKDFINYIIFVMLFIVVPAGFVFADTYDFTHFHVKDENKSKWQLLTNRFHAAEITLFCALVFCACIRRVRSTGHSVLLLLPYVISVVALDFTDLVPAVTAASFPEFLQPLVAPLVGINLLAHVVMTYAIPAITLFILIVLPEEDDGSAAAILDKELAKVAAEMLKNRTGQQAYYLRSCPAAVPSAVSTLIRVVSNGRAQIDAIIPAIVTAFIPVSGYFLQARIAKAIIVSTVIFLIWFDFYERQLKGENLQSFKAFFDLDPSTPLEHAPRKIVNAMLHPENEDRAFHRSLFNHLLSCIMVHLFQFFDVLTYKSSSQGA